MHSNPPASDPDDTALSLSETQHTQLYRARHLIELIEMAAESSGEFLTLRSESFTVVLTLIGELLDSAAPNMIFKRKHA